MTEYSSLCPDCQWLNGKRAATCAACRVDLALADEHNQLILERDRANLAFAELHTSHRVLTQARDDNSRRIQQLRDQLFAIHARATQQLATQSATERAFVQEVLRLSRVSGDMTRDADT